MKKILLLLLITVSLNSFGQNAFKGANSYKGLQSYETNLGSLFSARSLVDKNYNDSARNKARDSVVALLAGSTTIYTGNGSLTGNRTITGGAYTTTFTHTGSGAAITGNATGSGSGISGLGNTNTGVYGYSASSSAIFGQGALGMGGEFLTSPASTNTVAPVIKVTRYSNGTAANGIGGSIDFSTEVVSGNAYTSGRLISKFTDATDATRKSQFDINGVNNTTEEVFANFQTGGIVRVNNNADTLATKADIRNAIASGTFTPTISSTSNISSYTFLMGRYSRVGNTVTVTFAVNITPTATGDISFHHTLPVAITGTFATGAELSGVARSVAQDGGVAYGQDLANYGLFHGAATSTTATTWNIIYTYTLQ